MLGPTILIAALLHFKAQVSSKHVRIQIKSEKRYLCGADDGSEDSKTRKKYFRHPPLLTENISNIKL